MDDLAPGGGFQLRLAARSRGSFGHHCSLQELNPKTGQRRAVLLADRVQLPSRMRARLKSATKTMLERGERERDQVSWDTLLSILFSNLLLSVTRRWMIRLPIRTGPVEPGPNETFPNVTSFHLYIDYIHKSFILSFV